MKIAIAQLNVIVGDLTGNAEKIMAAAHRARADGAALLVTTELALSGYPPEDLLLRDGFFSLPFLLYRLQTSVVSVNPGGTGMPITFISARSAPLPPSSFLKLVFPSARPSPKV